MFQLARFNELLDTLGGLEGNYPETLLEDLMGAYDADMSETTGAHAGALDELTVANAELNTQLAALKQHNYDLLMSAPASGDVEGDPDGENDPDAEGESASSIDDLFEDEEN